MVESSWTIKLMQASCVKTTFKDWDQRFVMCARYPPDSVEYHCHSLSQCILNCPLMANSFFLGKASLEQGKWSSASKYTALNSPDTNQLATSAAYLRTTPQVMKPVPSCRLGPRSCPGPRSCSRRWNRAPGVQWDKASQDVRKDDGNIMIHRMENWNMNMMLRFMIGRISVYGLIYLLSRHNLYHYNYFCF